MFKNSTIALLLLLLSIFARAESLKLTQEFWEYLDDVEGIDDDSGDNFIDPLDYDQFLAISGDEDRERQPDNSLLKTDKPILRHADMVIDKQSSEETSSSVMTGTSL